MVAVKDELKNILHTPAVDRLMKAVEEASRATSASTSRFVEPASNTLSRAMSKRNHIIFGRRGSGKTSLLLKAKRDLTLKRVPVAFVDMEQFKGHSYPDVLISVLIATLESFREWIEKAGIEPSSRVSWWKRTFGGKAEKPALNRDKALKVGTTLAKQISTLQQLLHREDEAEVNTKLTQGSTETVGDSFGLEVKLDGFGASIGTSETTSSTSSVEVSELTRLSKINYLHRHILTFRAVFGEISDLAGTDAYLMLDDLYHIRRSDQAYVLDYFHRITKGNQVWMKVGTIRHRTEWYRHSDPPTGLKLGDDADEIDLDVTLERFATARQFLSSVLKEIADEVDAGNPRDLMAEGALDRLVLASGGVARDFLTIFRRSIEVARERGGGHRGPKIGAEDVNRAAGEHDTSKREELKRDTLEERQRLESLFDSIRDFCFNTRSNCFLVERDLNQEPANDIEELVDLRLIHRINPRVTVRDRPGRLYIAYMLDLSQYTGDRKRRGLNMIEFWSRQEADQLRRSGLIYAERALPKKGAGRKETLSTQS